ncbi:MAG: serine/threonine-protein kinase [Pseudomonadota bacterium]
MPDAPSTVEGGPPALAVHSADALPEGARLAEFEIRRVLGAGGFGIVYLAWDHALEREVALKEYMPVTLAARAPDHRVTLRAAVQQETFALGLRSFVNEARLLARFDHPSLVKVYRFWEANGTAYMVMHMVQGRTLRQVRQQMAPGSPGEAWCRTLIEPLLGALEALHREGVFHRDIAPDNIVLDDAGKPVLLDFGAARRVIGDRTHALTAILKPHFAPIEQYADVASMRQGPWTDLYGLAATFYYLLVGQPPLPAAARALHDELPPLARLLPAECSPDFLQALDWGMAVRPQQRPQSVAIWRDALEGRMPVPSLARHDVTTPGVTTLAVARGAATAHFDPTLPMSAAGLDAVPRPGGSTPATAPVWRGFTVPGGVGTVQAAAETVAGAAHDAQAATAPARSMRRRHPWTIGALAGGALLGLAAAFAWRMPPVPAAPASSAPQAAAAAAQPAPAGPAAAIRPAAVTPERQTLPPGAVTLPTPVVPPGTQPAGTAPSGTPPRDEPVRERARARVRGSGAAQAVVKGPAERCADRVFIARLLCMQRACDGDRRLRRHPECVRMREAERERHERMLFPD